MNRFPMLAITKPSLSQSVTYSMKETTLMPRKYGRYFMLFTQLHLGKINKHSRTHTN